MPTAATSTDLKTRLREARQGTVLTFSNILKRDHLPRKQDYSNSSQASSTGVPVFQASSNAMAHHTPLSYNSQSSLLPPSSSQQQNQQEYASSNVVGEIGIDVMEGAPNFREVTGFAVYGVSQPTTTGLKSITSLLLLKNQSIGEHCDRFPKYDGPEGSSTISLSSKLGVGAGDNISDSVSANNTSLGSKIYWFNTREEPVIYIHGVPYVLRDVDQPKRNIHMYAGISADRLEQMEYRLKLEILKEASLANNFILIHDETQSGDIQERIVHVGQDDVKTLKEVMNDLCQEHVVYLRVPMSPNQRPEDLHLDLFVDVISRADFHDALVFNCGFGAARTTFGMVVALLIRQAKTIGFAAKSFSTISGSGAEDSSLDKSAVAPVSKSVTASAQNPHLKMLSLLSVIERGISEEFGSPVQFTVDRAHLVPSLLKALGGDYSIISSLLSVLDYQHTKTAVDEAIDKCDHVINLRHEILVCRVRYFCTRSDDFLMKSLGYLERYFFLLCFASFIFQNRTNQQASFYEWLRGRHEILNMLNRLRRATNRLLLFRPVEELSNLKTELDENVISERDGAVLGSHVILKNDQWIITLPGSPTKTESVQFDGAPNFRQINNLPLFAVAQPKVKALQDIVQYICGSFGNIVWINLREEPLCYVNGCPYVLRDKYVRLRNLKSYAGISEQHLNALEQKLRHDVTSEASFYDGMLLVHEEVQPNTVKPVWIKVEDVKTLKEMYNTYGCLDGKCVVKYRRIPVTSEAPFELNDFDELLSIVCENRNSAFVLNCQMGVGRSTSGSVILSLILAWLEPERFQIRAAKDPEEEDERISYHIINSLIRSLKNGVYSKKVVDAAIDMCSSNLNIRKCINEYKLKADSAQTKHQTTELITKALNSLNRYYTLIAFHAYLEEQLPPPETRQTFKEWFLQHAELVNSLKELTPSSLQPLGIAKDEIMQVVSNRRGNVLAQNMIMKFDHFIGCQKKGMPVLINGAPNFRGVSVTSSAGTLARVYGVAMPTKSAILELLNFISSGEDEEFMNSQKLIWTSLREEPVIYIRGLPYVLRKHEDPYKNIETTGIERTRVERMEAVMKEDVLEELKQYSGKIMLHEEEGGSNGFRIVPVWETVEADQVETPLEVFESLRKGGYNVDYLRIPITDEQAPIPHVFDLLIQQVSRMTTIGHYSLFNCQMGRGRTTTGMVIACVLSQFLLDRSQSPVHLSNGNTSLEDLLETKLSILSTKHSRENSEVPDANEKTRLLNGDFKIILRLLRVLQHGRLAKRLTDSAIDHCQHIQNIREAIYEYKIRYEKHVEQTGGMKATLTIPSSSSRTRRRSVADASWTAYEDEDFTMADGSEEQQLRHVAVNYLVRYFYLVTFSGYVLEWQSCGNREAFPIFSDWLGQRREITSIIESDIALD